MLKKTHFKKRLLVQSLQRILQASTTQSWVFLGLIVSVSSSVLAAGSDVISDSDLTALSSDVKQQNSSRLNEKNTTTNQQNNKVLNTAVQSDDTSVDSMAMLQQQNPQLTEFKPVTEDDLEKLPELTVNQSLVDEINREAEQAKQDAQAQRNAFQQVVHTTQPTAEDITAVATSPINIDQLMNDIQADRNIDVSAKENTSSIFNDAAFNLNTKAEKKEKNPIKRWIQKIRPKNDFGAATVPKISVAVEGAPTVLQDNIKNKLSTFTQEAFEDYNVALPQLRALTVQAAQAVGYYDAEFKFTKTGDNSVTVHVTPKEPVKVSSQNIEFSGAGENHPQFQVIRLIPDLDVGDVLNHGTYELMKSKINEAATDNGFFDGYWRLHDVKVQRPENTADINLRYETGDRYKLKGVEFRMSDPTKPLPLKLKVLQSMVPWNSDDDYAAWRVNTLANNLTNSRYFNWSLVETIKPDPISKPLELPDDVQKLVDEENSDASQVVAQVQDKNSKKTAVSDKEVSQNVVDEKQFAGTGTNVQSDQQTALDSAQKEKKSEHEQLQEQARAEKKIPVIVTLNADKLNSTELGLGWGTDTGVRVRSQYRRAIVNSYGHSFEANTEVSQIRQAIDTRYNIPYKHPLNDYISLIGGYEREKYDGVGPGMSLTTQTAVVGAERVIRNPLGKWQQTYGLRYRLDQIKQVGEVDVDDVPDAFLKPGSNPQQKALLASYQLSRTDSNDPVNPTKGFSQSYKIQLGSESLLSDANMAILNADWAFIYSLGTNDNHQFVTSAKLGYIFTDDFNNVPYNLRFFAGGDQSIRGFDYKSLSPMEDGYRIGGQVLAIGSLEYNYQFKQGWRAAVFTDFGNAYDKNFSNPTAYSVGVGIRWQSPIGPIRIDVASGISDDSHPIRLHFFIGSQL
ncbi:MAG: autotransporter assembly complex family protein [Acinetobacter sp.]